MKKRKSGRQDKTSRKGNVKETTAKLLKRKKIINCGAFIVMQ
jgi:hypothetical protein